MRFWCYVGLVVENARNGGDGDPSSLGYVVDGYGSFGSAHYIVDGKKEELVSIPVTLPVSFLYVNVNSAICQINVFHQELIYYW